MLLPARSAREGRPRLRFGLVSDSDVQPEDTMFETWMIFVLGAVLSWGVYVPVLHEGQRSMGGGNPSAGALRSFLCVGVAYFITAVLIPLGVLVMASEGSEKLEFRTSSGDFNTRAVTFATLGGIAGA